MVSTTASSVHYLEKLGYTARKVEYFNFFSKRRFDFIGCIDILAFRPEEQGVLGVQSTTIGMKQPRADKAMTECGVEVKRWLASGNRFVIHGWDRKRLVIMPILLKDDHLIRGATKEVIVEGKTIATAEEENIEL